MEKTNELIKTFKEAFRKVGGNAYIVGGYIRDKLINSNSKPKDIDFIYDGSIERLALELEGMVYKISPVKDDMSIWNMVEGDITISISKMNGESIEEDLGKRDFTINAIAMNLLENKVIDPFKGRNAIISRILHNVNDKSLEYDPVRILRGIKLYISYGMHFSLETEKKVIEMAPRLKECNKKRVFNEFMKIIQCDREGRAFQFLDDYNILRNMFPYIDDLKNIGKCKYHLEDVFTHMNLTYETFKNLLNGRIKIEGLDLNLFDEYIGDYKLREYVAFACFLHDIGKFRCYKEEKDKVSFHGHDKEGARIAKEVCEGMDFPKEAVELISILVEGHMYLLEAFKSTANNEKKSIDEFFDKYNKYVILLIVVSFCDVYATKMIYDPKNEKVAYEEFIGNILAQAVNR